MAVVEHDADGVVADRLEPQNADAGRAGDELALLGRMALHLGRGAFDAQQFRRQAKRLAVVELNSRIFSARLRRISVALTAGRLAL